LGREKMKRRRLENIFQQERKKGLADADAECSNEIWMERKVVAFGHRLLEEDLRAKMRG